ncbi:hypothetical protein JVT61DRAFT_7844 [Boletus reticuloceps]|uniref:Uncharacterized protein n=1 Tax=Boletus reticuloceps TaxID=495285 RepID=A0A8I2YHZ0_9AGAM|nr:hypothetical protein JVT61DRAFT_7844 [Boletus reticuloceps]
MASGFHYDDVKGVAVDDVTRHAWELFCRSHPGVMKYEGNGWPYWNDVTPLVSAIPKSSHLHRPMKSKSKRSQKQHKASTANAIPQPEAGPSGTQIPMSSTHVDQMAICDHGTPMDYMAVNHLAPSHIANQVRAIADPPTVDPDAIPPSTPSTYLLHPPKSVVSLAMTSVNQKRKVSSIIESSAVSEGPKKRSCPLSAATRAKADGAITLQRLSNFLETIGPLVLQPITLTLLGLPLGQMQLLSPPTNPTVPIPSASDDDYIERAVEALMLSNLSPSENNNLANYMSDVQNKMRVKFFLKFNQSSHELWIKNALAEIKARRNSERAIQRMDEDR